MSLYVWNVNGRGSKRYFSLFSLLALSSKSIASNCGINWSLFSSCASTIINGEFVAWWYANNKAECSLLSLCLSSICVSSAIRSVDYILSRTVITRMYCSRGLSTDSPSTPTWSMPTTEALTSSLWMPENTSIRPLYNILVKKSTKESKSMLQ